MSYCKNKKFKNYAVTAKLENIANKENICDFQKPDSQYLYVNPIYLNNQLGTYNTRRLEGGDYHSDVFYDCDSSVCKDDVQNEPLKIQQFRICDVLNEIDTPKEFKRALKQLIFTSQILYRTFRQAYRKTKKSQKTSTKSGEEKTAYCPQCRADKKSFERKMDASDLKNFLKPDNGNKTKNLLEKKRISDVQTEREPCNTCASCSNMKAPMCDCCKCPPTIYQPTEGDLTDDYICEECAVFKGEISTPKAIEKIYQNSYQTGPPGIYESTIIGSMNNSNDGDQSTEDIAPIRLTIPVELQINPNVGNVRLLNTVDTVNQSTNSKETQTFVQQLTATQPTQTAQAEQPNKLFRIQEQTELVPVLQPILNDKKQDETTNTRTQPQEIAKIDENIVPEKPFKQQTKLDEIIMKTDQLRSELVQEIKMALEQTLPTDAMQGLKKGDFVAVVTNNDKQLPKELTMPAVSTQDTKKDKRMPLPAIMEANNETDDTSTRDRLSLPGATVPIKVVQPEPLKPLASDAAAASEMESETVLYIDPDVSSKPADLYKAEGVQTTVSAIKPFGHYQRNEMRRDIQEHLKELIEKRSEPSTRSKYTKEDRNEILFELHRLFHPVKSDLMASEQKRQSILHDLHYIMNPNLPTDLKTSNLPASEEIIIDSVRYILNPKAEHKDKTKIRKYESGIKHKILENFLIILKPSQERTPADQVTRNSAFLEIRLLLDTGVVQSSSRQIQKMVSSMRVRETKQQMEKLADLRYAQDPTVVAQASKEEKLGKLNKKKSRQLHKKSSKMGMQETKRQIEKLADQRYGQGITTGTAQNRNGEEKPESSDKKEASTEKKQRRATFQ